MTQIMSTDSEALAQQKRNYNTLILENYAEHPAAWRTDDELPHIEDTPLYGAIRNGEYVELTWNQLTDDEIRAIYVATFDPCGLEVY